MIKWKDVSLKDISSYSTERINVDKLTVSNYISTENMLPDRGGKIKASSLPSSKTVSKYESDDILISNIRPYFKKIWYANQTGGCSNDVLVIRNNNPEKIVSRYLYYCLFTDDFFDYVMSGAKGAKMPRGDKDEIMKYQISLPPLSVQEQIAEMLTNIDNKISLNTKMNKTLEEIAINLYNEWFTNFGPFKDGEFIESELGMIPKGWEIKKLSDLVNTQYGYTESATEKKIGPHFLRITDIQDRFISWDRVPYCPIDVKDYEKYKLNKGDIVIARTGNSTGAVGYINSNIEAVYASFLVRLTPKTDYLSTHFLYLLTTSKEYQSYIERAGTGSARKGANAKLMTNYYVVISPKEIMAAFHKKVDNIFEKIEKNIWENINLKNIRDYLLPRLISGEIDVTKAKKHAEEVL